MGGITMKSQEVRIDQMLSSAMKILEDLHIVHKKTAFDELIASTIPGTDITLANLINETFKIIKPFIAVARKNFPLLFAVLDWAEEIFSKLLSK